MFKKPTDEKGLQMIMTQLMLQMKDLPADSPEFASAMNHLKELHKMKDDNSRSRRVSADTLAIVVGNLAGIGMILSYEHSRVVASKALAFVLKAR